MGTERNLFCKQCSRTRAIALFVTSSVLVSLGVEYGSSLTLSQTLLSALGVTP